jgi:hypothetical protein
LNFLSGLLCHRAKAGLFNVPIEGTSCGSVHLLSLEYLEQQEAEAAGDKLQWILPESEELLSPQSNPS